MVMKTKRKLIVAIQFVAIVKGLHEDYPIDSSFCCIMLHVLGVGAESAGFFSNGIRATTTATFRMVTGNIRDLDFLDKLSTFSPKLDRMFFHFSNVGLLHSPTVPGRPSVHA
eukprot:scaffold3410_cov141-Cylindrotheca_fusiformis.AAC.33